MKKASLLVVVGLVGLASCNSKCPAYTRTKPASPQHAAPAMVLTAQAAPTPQPE